MITEELLGTHELNSRSLFQTERDLTSIFPCQSQNTELFFTSLDESMKPNLSQKAMKLSPNDNRGTVRNSWIEFKKFISNWKRFDLYFPLPKPKYWARFYFSWWKYQTKSQPKAMKLSPNDNRGTVRNSWNWIQEVYFKLKEIWPLFSLPKPKYWALFYFSWWKYETKISAKRPWS